MTIKTKYLPDWVLADFGPEWRGLEEIEVTRPNLLKLRQATDFIVRLFFPYHKDAYLIEALKIANEYGQETKSILAAIRASPAIAAALAPFRDKAYVAQANALADLLGLPRDSEGKECQSSPDGRHQMVNAGFTSITMACKYCGMGDL